MHEYVDVDMQVYIFMHVSAYACVYIHACECICMHTHAWHAYSTRRGSPSGGIRRGGGGTTDPGPWHIYRYSLLAIPYWLFPIVLGGNQYNWPVL